MHTNKRILLLATIAFTMVLLVNLKMKLTHSIDKKSEEITSKVILSCRLNKCQLVHGLIIFFIVILVNHTTYYHIRNL